MSYTNNMSSYLDMTPNVVYESYFLFFSCCGFELLRNVLFVESDQLKKTKKGTIFVFYFMVYIHMNAGFKFFFPFELLWSRVCITFIRTDRCGHLPPFWTPFFTNQHTKYISLLFSVITTNNYSQHHWINNLFSN